MDVSRGAKLLVTLTPVKGYFGSDHSPVVMRLANNWVQFADKKDIVSKLVNVTDEMFESAILSRLELESKSKECEMFEALMEEQAAPNVLACVTAMSNVESA